MLGEQDIKDEIAEIKKLLKPEAERLRKASGEYEEAKNEFYGKQKEVERLIDNVYCPHSHDDGRGAISDYHEDYDWCHICGKHWDTP